jgi:hypothetical protein
MIKERIAAGQGEQYSKLHISSSNYYIAIVPIDFHPHWHINRPPPGFEYIPPPPIILDPISRQLRRTQEAERRAHVRANNRLRIAQTGRILSQFEQRQGVLRHCSACTELRHDKATCGGCKSTGHIRSTCPFVPRAMPSLANTVAIQSNSAASSNSGARNRLYSTQPLLLPQQSQMSEYWERSIPGGSQSTQFGLGLGVSDTEEDVLVPATQY